MTSALGSVILIASGIKSQTSKLLLIITGIRFLDTDKPQCLKRIQVLDEISQVAEMKEDNLHGSIYNFAILTRVHLCASELQGKYYTNCITHANASYVQTSCLKLLIYC